MTLPDNYDPKPEAKIWYRHVLDGQLGWYVRRGGVPKIRLDRPDREILKPFNKQDWNLCDDYRALTPYQIGEITFESDKVICRILGKYKEARASWQNMPHQDRLDWTNNGPSDDPLRIKLYRSIKEIMAKHEEDSRKSNPE